MIDVALDMTRVTLDVLERTIFTGVGGSRRAGAPSPAFSKALGPVDPLDMFGLPNWIPRIGRLRARPSIHFFEETVRELIEARKALVCRGEPGAAGSPHPLAPGGGGSGNRKGADRHRSREDRHVHRRRTRHHGERPSWSLYLPLQDTWREPPLSGKSTKSWGKGGWSRGIWIGLSIPVP